MPNTKLAHKHAYEDVGVLHRDISVGNILITTAGGLLIDWDLCKHVRDLATAARQSERTVSFFEGDYVCVDIYFMFSVL
jgi:RIO-like serine/threonine protein kinase